MPSWEIFDHQTHEYQDSVLPPHVKARVAAFQGCHQATCQTDDRSVHPMLHRE